VGTYIILYFIYETDLGVRYWILIQRVIGLKNAIFWDMALCRSSVNRRFEGTLADFSTLKMKVIHSSEMSVHTRSTQHHIPEDGILHSHCCENLKSYGL
jgi:hypothetical protein